jgi:hypothetical protein
MWKGTEVAVKMLLTTTSSAATKELERSFKEEVRNYYYFLFHSHISHLTLLVVGDRGNRCRSRS